MLSILFLSLRFITMQLLVERFKRVLPKSIFSTWRMWYIRTLRLVLYYRPVWRWKLRSPSGKSRASVCSSSVEHRWRWFLKWMFSVYKVKKSTNKVLFSYCFCVKVASHYSAYFFPVLLCHVLVIILTKLHIPKLRTLLYLLCEKLHLQPCQATRTIRIHNNNQTRWVQDNARVKAWGALVLKWLQLRLGF